MVSDSCVGSGEQNTVEQLKSKVNQLEGELSMVKGELQQSEGRVKLLERFVHRTVEW